MNKQTIYIVGLGMGTRETLTDGVYNLLKKAQVVCGAKRLVEAYEQLNLGGDSVNVYATYKALEIKEIIQATNKETIVILMSGDSGFHSGTKQLVKALESLKKEKALAIKIEPGISSIAYFAAKLQTSWEDAKLVSLHGTQVNILQLLKVHKKIFLLIDDKFEATCQKLCNSGLGKLALYIGRNLGFEDEELWQGTIETYKMLEGLQVAMILQPNQERTQQIGIPENQFIRAHVPMTKSEVRAVIMSKLALQEEDIVYDVGAGTGSVSIEMALAVPKGKVYAIECQEEGVELITQNSEKFGCHNIEVIHGKAPEVLEELEKPDVVFIGGTKKQLGSILEVLQAKNYLIRVVIATVTAESFAEAMQCMETFEVRHKDIVQVSITKLQPVGSYHMFQAQNPIIVFSGDLVGKKEVEDDH